MMLTRCVKMRSEHSRPVLCDVCGTREATIHYERDVYPKDKRKKRVLRYEAVDICRYCYERELNNKLREAVK